MSRNIQKVLFLWQFIAYTVQIKHEIKQIECVSLLRKVDSNLLKQIFFYWWNCFSHTWSGKLLQGGSENSLYYSWNSMYMQINV